MASGWMFSRKHARTAKLAVFRNESPIGRRETRFVYLSHACGWPLCSNFSRDVQRFAYREALARGPQHQCVVRNAGLRQWDSLTISPEIVSPSLVSTVVIWKSAPTTAWGSMMFLRWGRSEMGSIVLATLPWVWA